MIYISYAYGFDLSMECTGITIFDLNTFQPVLVESIHTNKKDSHGIRLYHIGKRLLELKEMYPPKVIILERGFSRFNTSTQVIYRVHGLVNYLFYDVEQIYYPPKKIKEVIIKGDASKELVRKVIQSKYPNIEFKNEDESDSMATVLTWMIENKIIEWDKKLFNTKKKNKDK